MARPQKRRNICSRPEHNCFVPTSKENPEVVILTLDQYETIRLIDYEKLTQAEAAVKMDVARTTVQAIYEEARYILSDAIVNGKKILIEGGHIRFCHGQNKECNKRFGVCSNEFINDTYSEISLPNKAKIAFICSDDKALTSFKSVSKICIYEVENLQIKSQNIIDVTNLEKAQVISYLFDANVNIVIGNRIGKKATEIFLDEGIKSYFGYLGNCAEVLNKIFQENK